ncbi:MAG: 3-methyl-2-oxobutanoate hydroxymethyltransferase [Pelagibacteraceae bacterium TMED124]|nr:3-methyl-2-oxobutanoate hydroxymethyltransferase [Rickettsiales bacterium]RPG18409.1 MAG: 3-methyl-2-oxobutanoate hydroxymethyltransferase [Pelagibacteraceae bacterium TMED124]
MFLKKKKIFEKFKKKIPIICITSYTAPIAKIADKYADIILVGDSVGPVLYGFDSTRKVSIDLILQHAKAVVAQAKDSMVVVDMPYGTFEKDYKLAYRNAKKIILETGADAVKLEGGEKFFDTITFLVKKKINVMGHIGLLPQQHNGKYPVYGRKKNEEKKIMDDLNSLQKAGVFSVVVECTVESIVKKLMKNSNIPIIGIGATSDCDGQVLVAEDLLGLTDFKAKFLKKYSNLDMIISRAFEKFSSDVVKRKYPQKKNYYK